MSTEAAFPLAPPAPSDSAKELFARAAACQRRGDIDGAESLCRDALGRDSAHGPSLHLLGQIRALKGGLDEAAGLMELAARHGFDSAEARNNRGVVLKAAGRHAEAAHYFEKALEADPRQFEATLNLGMLLLGLGRPGEARAPLRRALELRPGDALAARQMGLAALRSGNAAEAAAHLERSLEAEPGRADALNNLGMAYQKLGRVGESLERLRQALVANPRRAETHFNLGNAVRESIGPGESLAHFERATVLDPNFAEAHNNFGEALQASDRLDEAAWHYDRAVALKPGYPEARSNLGTALQALNRPEAAIPHLEEALRLRPDYADAWNNLGAVLGDLGRFDDAVRAFERAIALAPRRMDFHRNLAGFKRYAPGDGHLAAMEAIAASPGSLADCERSDLHFALGKAWEDLGDPARSFDHLLQGNALHRRHHPYDEPGTVALFNSLKAAFPREIFRRREGRGPSSSIPVFIFGMPRSGTTLVEQILASHTAVFGGGELPYLEQASASLLGSYGGDGRIPDTVASLGDADWHRAGSGYLHRIQALSGAARITDKLPSNFRLAGLIALALPGARMIHVRRDPVDTCLSCFSKKFVHSQPHTYDLAELGRYYRAYEELMEHWREVLPPGAMLEIDYEEIVADVEGQARRIVAHCGLDWDPTCTAFHRNQRPVRTASATQVRCPVYGTSVGRWRAYGDRLRPLLDALGRG